MNTTKSLVVHVNGSYELAVATSIALLLRKRPGLLFIQLFAPRQLLNLAPSRWKAVFDENIEMPDPRLNLASLSALRDVVEFQRLFKLRSLSKPDSIFFGAWRSPATSLILRLVDKDVPLVATVQGQDAAPYLYDRSEYLRNAHDRIFNSIFGGAHWNRKKPSKNSDGTKFRSNFWKLDWYQNPITRLIRLAEPGAIESASPSETVISPPFSVLKTLYRGAPKSGKKKLLLVGERTPLVANWNEKNEKALDGVLRILPIIFKDYEIVLRARPGYTNSEVFKASNIRFATGVDTAENFILNERPDVVLAAKSTVVKFAHYLGIPASFYFPALKLDDIHNNLISAFCADVPNVLRVQKPDDLHRLAQMKSTVPEKQNSENFWSLIFGLGVEFDDQ